MSRRVAVLDDYQAVAEAVGPWDRLGEDTEVTFFHDHLARGGRPGGAAPSPSTSSWPCGSGRPFRPAARAAPAAAPARDHGHAQRVDRRRGSAGARRLGVRHGRHHRLHSRAHVGAHPGRVQAVSRRRTRTSAQAAGRSRWGRSSRAGRWASSAWGTWALAWRAIGQAFGMNVVAWSENLDPDRAAQPWRRARDPAELLARSDVVTMHLRLSDRTPASSGRPSSRPCQRTRSS